MEIKINVKEILERADIKRIREFILDDVIIADNYDGTYQERIDRDSEEIIYALEKLSKENTEKNHPDETMQDFKIALFAYRDVFTEIGMKIGARLLYQLLHEND